jgi:hypothetical protein
MVTLGQIAAAESANCIADHPLFVATNVFELYNNQAQWRGTTGTGRGSFPTWSSGSDITETGYPTRFAYDRQLTSVTRPLYTSSTTNYAFLADLHTGSDNAHTFDTVAIINHHLDTYSSNTVTITVSLSDQTTFPSTEGSDTPASVNMDFSVTAGGSAQRIVLTNLTIHSQAYSRVTQCRYIRINFAVPAAQGTVPWIGEVVFGRRHQMSYFPDVPWEDQGLRSDVVDFNGKSGSRVRYTRHSGQRIYTPTFHSGGVDTVGLNQETELRTMFAESSYGSLPVLYVNNPFSASGVAPYVYIEHPEISYPVLGPFERMGSMTLTETAPFQAVEV